MSVVYKFVKNLFFPSLVCSHAIFPGGHIRKFKNIIKKSTVLTILLTEKKTKIDQSVIESILEIQWIGLLKARVRSEKIV